MWHKLLSLRDQVSGFIKRDVHGESVKFWWDNKVSKGRLYGMVGDAGPHNLRVRLLGSVFKVGNNSAWLLRRCLGQRLREIIGKIQQLPVPNAE